MAIVFLESYLQPLTASQRLQGCFRAAVVINTSLLLTLFEIEGEQKPTSLRTVPVAVYDGDGCET